MLYMVTFTINIPPMLAYIYIPYMDPMGYDKSACSNTIYHETNGGVLKWGYPLFHYKPSILGYPHCRKPPNRRFTMFFAMCFSFFEW